MSEVAEFARIMHEKETKQSAVRTFEPVVYSGSVEQLHNIRLVVCDVYGTLINYWREGFGSGEQNELFLLPVFKRVIDRFGMEPILCTINPADPPEKTLRDFYHGLIALNHEKAVKKGTNYPEVVIEEVWNMVLLLLQRRGYQAKDHFSGTSLSFARKIAYYYNFHALGRGLYPGVVETLAALAAKNIKAGLLSNGQFYTPIDLTLFIRDQSNGKYDDLYELFDVDLTFFSYEYRVAKPNQLLFRRLYDALYEFQILPSQTVFIGNDLVADIAAAQEAGMHTALFTGDSKTTFFHDSAQKIIPDISFTSWPDLISKLSFHDEESA